MLIFKSALKLPLFQPYADFEVNARQPPPSISNTQPESAVILKLCKEYAPVSLPTAGNHKINFSMYSYMMQLQRDTIRALVERDMELERSKEYKIRSQELLIQQSIAAHNAMFGCR